MSTRSNRHLCQNWKLYVITDAVASKNSTLQDKVARAIQGGANVIQLRDKEALDEALVLTARALLELTKPAGVPLIVNDRPRVAKMAHADGVHLGQDDGSLAEAKKILGEDAIYGRSTHSPQQALKAQEEGFDYIGVGPVFRTPTKPAYEAVGLGFVRFASQNIQIPFVAIGGIDKTNVGQVMEAGARCIAVVRAVMAAEDPRAAAAMLRREHAIDKQ